MKSKITTRHGNAIKSAYFSFGLLRGSLSLDEISFRLFGII